MALMPPNPIKVTAPVILGEQRLNFKWISSLFISGHPVDGENDGRDAGDVPGG